MDGLTVIGKNVIIQSTIEEQQGIIFIPNAKTLSERNELARGTVVGVGDEVIEDIHIGDVVWYVEGTFWKNDKRVNGDEFTLDGKNYICVKEHEIRAIETT